MSEISHRNVKILVREREVSPLWWFWPILIAAIILGLISFLWLRGSLETGAESFVSQTMEKKGLDISGLKIKGDYRDIEITGASTAGLTAEEIKGALGFKKNGDWNHKLNVLDIQLDAPKVVAVKTGPTDVKGMISATGIVLSGEVLSQSQKDEIQNAAMTRYGKENVTNNITISGVKEATPGADGRTKALAMMIAGIPKGVTGTGTLSDTNLSFVGDAASASNKPAFQKVFDGLTGVESSLSLNVPEVVKQIDTLDEEFTALSIEIQRRVVFKTASAVLKSTARTTLDKAVVLMNKYTLPVVSISGHTDDRGDAEKNKKLSQRRAQAVIDYLSKKGIDMARLQAIGAGETQPLVSNDTAEGRQKNRRVVFTAKKTFN